MNGVNEESVFAQALEIENLQERAAFLDRACAGNPALRQSVQSLLSGYGAGRFLERPAPAPAVTTDEPICERLGTVIGPYKLMEQIGEGGMGLVFVAEQQHPVRRKVALKVIKPGMDSRQVIARFEAERQALALMDHPNIARVLDAGTTASGRPFFVMELVKGVPITDYCDQNQVPIRQRLELFLHVCHAVQHAHQKGIIHRDVKPSNVLVMSQDGTPLVKVIDFGVAKAIGQQLTDKTIYTQFAQLVGTPLYMSPEQAGQSSLDVDTRSDIYSLGVLLYELLTGTTPFDKERLKEVDFDELRRIIREEEPPKPSTRISTLGQAASTVSTNRKSDPKQLSGLLRVELDWIVMKALEKDRNRRYESASGFAADVERYLRSEPVQACPPSATYRIRKFVRRHRRAVLAATAIVVLLVSGISATTLALVRAVQGENDADEKRILAEQREQQAEEARGRTRDALNMVTDDVIVELLGKQVELGEPEKAYLRKVARLYEEFAHSQGDSVQARRDQAGAYQRLASVHYRLGEIKEAEAAQRAALAHFQQLVIDIPVTSPHLADLAKSQSSLGIMLYDTGRLDEAEAAYRDSQRIFQQLVADSPAVPEYRYYLALVHNSQGNLFNKMNRLQDANLTYGQAHAELRELATNFPAERRYRQQLALIQNNRGNLLKGMRQLHEAEAACSNSVALYQKLAADFPSVTAYRLERVRSQNNLGGVLATIGKRPQAKAAFDDAVRLAEELAADFLTVPEYRLELARSKHNVATLLANSGQMREAEAPFREALALRKKLAASFPRVPLYRKELAETYRNLGDVLADTSRPRQAEEALRKAVAVLQKLTEEFPLAEYRQSLARSYNSLGALLFDMHRGPEAEAAYCQARAAFQKLTTDSPKVPDYANDLAGTLVNLARSKNTSGNHAEAHKLLIEARPYHQRSLAANPGNANYRRFFRNSLIETGQALLGLGDHAAVAAEAEELSRVGYEPSDDGYNAACFLARCIPLAEKDSALRETQRQELAHRYADRAMVLLRQAVQAGWKDAIHTRKDSDLDTLRNREDFRRLLAELEQKKK